MNTDELNFVVLSDIHFRTYKDHAFDLDSELRNELLFDVSTNVANVGQIHGIVVVGDVAFAGKDEQYEEATRFLRDLSQKANCPEENVWTIPGNHDVDRSVIASSHLIKLAHRDIRQAGASGLDAALRDAANDPQVNSALLAPLESYNRFANRYGCGVDPQRGYWEQDLRLNDNSILRLRGINSTLISGPDDNDEDQKLVVGAHQTLLLREEGVAFMTLCHHPVDWLIDSDAVIDALDNRASVQIFGHKHRQRFRPVGDQSLCIAAGAVQPDRGQIGWAPSYNLVSLRVDTSNSERRLLIKVWARTWKDATHQFNAEVSRNDTLLSQFSLQLGKWGAGKTAVQSFGLASSTVPVLPVLSAENQFSRADEAKELPINEEPAIMINPERRLMFRFFGLSHPQIVHIASNLDLLEADDVNVKDSERYQRYYKRAKERGHLAALWHQVESRYGDGMETPNPFESKGSLPT